MPQTHATHTPHACATPFCSIAYSLAHAVPEVFPILLTLAFGLPLALPGLLILTIDLITEQCPAISLSYEPAESEIMLRPPRNMKLERLVDGRLLRYSYAIVGLAITAFCLLSYFTVFASYGVSGAVLWDSFRGQWQDSSPPLTLSNGQTLDGSTQKGIYQEAISAYYFTLVACQGWHVFTCKTRFIALREHGPMRNPTTLVGVMVAVFVAILFIYITTLHSLFQTQVSCAASGPLPSPLPRHQSSPSPITMPCPPCHAPVHEPRADHGRVLVFAESWIRRLHLHIHGVQQAADAAQPDGLVGAAHAVVSAARRGVADSAPRRLRRARR